jgi:hypothetical protein
MAANTADLGKLVAAAIAPTMAEYGLTIPELYIENISLPPAVEAALDKRTSMGLVGDLGQFTQYSAAEAMTRAAARAGRRRRDGCRRGRGAGHGDGRPDGRNPGRGALRPRPPVAPPPPPPPVEHVWHIAENGATRGPFSRAALGRMAADGGLTRATLVWTAGQDGWQAAGDIAELAQLFTVMPPPPPPPVAG